MKSSTSRERHSGKVENFQPEVIYSFDTDKKPELSQVGGKGLSLIVMTQHGLPVPPGVVLSVAFFEPWINYIRKTPEWDQFSSDITKKSCDALKKICMSLKIDDKQKKALESALHSLKSGGLFSVRSSSPEEDLEGASFAGGYETTLGVTEKNMEDAIRRSFASLFDQRVFLYKKEHGFDIFDPNIAVVIQRQVASETAGVAFSLNPLNNCYDEAVINANYGLGESVVSGRVSPDTFVVDKVTLTILEKKQGKKERVIWLSSDGGTYEEAPPNQELCLSDEEVFSIIDMLVRVEEYYGKPIDIEWAFSHGHLYLLQARPITAYLPLPEEMVTAPGEPKRLYSDMTLSKQGIQEPMSLLGSDFMITIQKVLFEDIMGTKDVIDVDGLAFTVGGRGYINISNSVKLQGKKRVVDEWRMVDALAADIIDKMDEAYIPRKLPNQFRGIILRTALNSLDTGLKTVKAFINPGGYKKWFNRETERFLKDLKVLKEKRSGEISIGELADGIITRYVQYIDHVSLPVTYAAELARSRINHLFEKEEPEVRDKVIHLGRALPENITLEMGLAMYHLAQFKEVQECSSGEEFAKRIEEKSFSQEFLAAYNAFMDTYGFRSPRELDAATPRPYEKPGKFFEQLQIMAQNVQAETNPQAVYDKSKKEREQAYAGLVERAHKRGWLTLRLFTWFYHVLVEFGAYREIHKYYYIMAVDTFRRQVVSIAQSLVDAGRLDNTEQVFDLTIDDLERAMEDPSINLRGLAEKNTRFLRKIKDIHDFPPVIDSRGKIFFPTRREASEGELVGEPISPGTVRGPVKVLHTPDEKPVLPGDILVAEATDPGWTPLFINAGGVVLEIGGLLHHGALVAREYGKPCVAGIEDVTSLLQDGQEVEVDGLNGIVRVITDT